MSFMLLFLPIFLSILTQHALGDIKVVCYYESWTSYKGFNPEDFDASLCTHVNYAFVGVEENGTLKVEDKLLDVDRGLYKKVTDMKKSNSNLKVLLSVGGSLATSKELFSEIARVADKRSTFVESAKYFLTAYNFDGLDIDWEYPKAEDNGNFMSLLQQLRTLFDKNGWLLTAAVTCTPRDGYNVTLMNNLLDWFNIMSYDMYGTWSPYTGQCSPLYASSLENDLEKHTYNLAATGDNWVNAGASKEKILLGVAFYGRSFTLADVNQHGIHAPFTGAGVGTSGTIRYREICEKYDNWTRVWDDEQKNPYKYSGDQWFGYDDEESVRLKVEYIKANGFGGVMVWSIEGDDVHGICGTEQILLKRINGLYDKY